MYRDINEVPRRAENYASRISEEAEALFSSSIFGKKIGPFRDTPIFDEGERMYRGRSLERGTRSYKFKDYEDLHKFYSFLRKKGLNVHEISQEELQAKFGNKNDPVGYRTGNDIYVARDFHDKELPPVDRMGIAGHEYRAGYNHSNSDAAAQIGSVETFEYEFPHEAARKRAVEMAINAGWV